MSQPINNILSNDALKQTNELTNHNDDDDDLFNEQLSKISSAATEPIYLTHGNPNSLIDEIETIKNESNPSKKGRDKRTKLNRAQTAPILRFNYQQNIGVEYKIPNKLINKIPTVKQEVSIFYTIVQYFKAFKDEIIGKNLDRLDNLIQSFFSLPYIVKFIKIWHWGENLPYIGSIFQIFRCCLNTRLVFLLIFFPIGLIFYFQNQDYLAVIFLFLSLMFFAKVLSNTTEIASEHFGPVLGSLLNATFGNLVELIISGTTVSKEDSTLTITSLIGSIISNNLFVIGSCFFFGGLEGIKLIDKKPLVSNLVFFISITLLLSMMSVINDIDSNRINDNFKMNTSQITASFILVNYLVYLIMNTNEQFKALKVKKIPDEEITNDNNLDLSDDSDSEDDDSDFEHEEIIPSKIVCFGTLALSIAGLGPCANFFVESLKKLTDDKPISKVFIGLIILPLAGSLPEHISSIIAAHKGNMDLSINLAIGSSNQVIGFVLPIIQFISSHYPETKFSLYLEDYIASYLFICAFVSSACIMNGLMFGVNIFHGVLCITSFGFIVVLTFANA
ncbi:hypothetical protein WICMUC_000153 [Wickerhamomyces mucosus]|uniref:Sodium/calcium exchanger membrane region domain-containing protein n=1 Tax=Wickerhamomyces mucosus TaxID=1378264 RepID=A0A9P8Q069_9ASCO|nr:hypothetical protein WICMUC_000153 [Wickerhamomyces mucosus]